VSLLYHLVCAYIRLDCGALHVYTQTIFTCEKQKKHSKKRESNVEETRTGYNYTRNDLRSILLTSHSIVIHYHNRRCRPNLHIFLLSLLLLEEPHERRTCLGASPVNRHERDSNNASDSRKPRIGEVANSNSPRDTNETNNNGDGPLSAINTSRLDCERATSDKDDHNL
jgi:hypothetical protein